MVISNSVYSEFQNQSCEYSRENTCQEPADCTQQAECIEQESNYEDCNGQDRNSFYSNFFDCNKPQVSEDDCIDQSVSDECVDEVVTTPEQPVVEEEPVEEVVVIPEQPVAEEECVDEVVVTPEQPVVEEAPVEEVVEATNPNAEVFLAELEKLQNGSTECVDQNLGETLQQCLDQGGSSQSVIDFLMNNGAIDANEQGYPVFSAKGETLNHYLKQLLDTDYKHSVEGEEDAVDPDIAYVYQDMINAGLDPVRSLNNLMHQDLISINDEGRILPTETLAGLDLQLPEDALVA